MIFEDREKRDKRTALIEALPPVHAAGETEPCWNCGGRGYELDTGTNERAECFQCSATGRLDAEAERIKALCATANGHASRKLRHAERAARLFDELQTLRAERGALLKGIHCQACDGCGFIHGQTCPKCLEIVGDPL